MPPLPPIHLDALFRDPGMFDTKETFRAAGFEVKRASAHNIMVGRHPSAPNYLFKKYSRDVALRDQQANYESRAEGARRIKRFIEEQHLRHITVPQKWIYDLPSAFTEHGEKSRLLIVERLDILPTKEVEKRYHTISRDVLTELCRVLFKFQGLDSAIHNVRFVSSGQIAFIDTENWKRSKKIALRHIRRELSEDSLRFAKRVFKQLKRAAR